jgi:hypothetical protein
MQTLQTISPFENGLFFHDFMDNIVCIGHQPTLILCGKMGIKQWPYNVIVCHLFLVYFCFVLLQSFCGNDKPMRTKLSYIAGGELPLHIIPVGQWSVLTGPLVSLSQSIYFWCCGHSEHTRPCSKTHNQWKVGVHTTSDNR